MKKILALAIVLAGSSAFASLARVMSLQGAPHIVDVVSVFSRPSDMMILPEAMAVDFGTASTVGSNAEGGMIKMVGEGRLGFFVGVVDQTRTAGAGSYLGVENPFSVAYGAKAGDMPWAVVFSYASSAKKSYSCHNR